MQFYNYNNKRNNFLHLNARTVKTVNKSVNKVVELQNTVC
jgi:hypothetical protein